MTEKCKSCGHVEAFHLRYEEHWFGLQLKTFAIPCVICPSSKVCDEFMPIERKQEKKHD